MIKRIPLVPTQKEIFRLLTAYQDTPVYDKVPRNAVLPYITIGEFTCKPDGSKDADISFVTMQLHIWSDYEGKIEVNGIAEDILGVISHWPMDLSADNFNVMGQDYDMFEAFEEETMGYHGVITFVAKIQNLGA